MLSETDKEHISAMAAWLIVKKVQASHQNQEHPIISDEDFASAFNLAERHIRYEKKWRKSVAGK